MSHLHVPDGLLPIWIVILGWIITGAILVVVSRRLTSEDQAHRLALLGVIAALMLIGMSLDIAPIGYHVDLAVLAGIVLGPTLGFVAGFVVNLILAFLGHGGITVVGVNSLVLGVEVSLGYYAFRAQRALGHEHVSVGVAAGVAAVVSLLCSTLLMIAIVAIANISSALTLPNADVVAGTLVVPNPFGQGSLTWQLPVIQVEPRATGKLDIVTFARLVLGLGSAGWIIEGFVTGLIASYVARVRPDVLEPSRLPGSS
jgi:cobalt/nickel transport system permease protein